MKNKTLNFLISKLKKHYFVIIQISLIIFFMYAFFQTTQESVRNNSLIATNYKIDEVGEVIFYSPSKLLRNSDNQKIAIICQGENNNIQPVDIRIVISFGALPSSRQVIADITCTNIHNTDLVTKPLDITPLVNANPNDFVELFVEIYANNSIVKSGELVMNIEPQYKSLLRSTSLFALLFLTSTLVLTLFFQNYLSQRSEADNNLSRQLEMAENKVEETPEKIKPIWDVARFTLEKYINRNQQQVNLIFIFSISVMLVSFAIIIIGVYIAIKYPASFSIAILTAAVGVITEFIGATFLIVFKSTLQQASHYSKTLERIATIGVAVQILDTLVDDAKTGNIKSKTKSEIVKLLIKNQVSIDENSDNDKS